jgi:hypothetical protein
MAARSLLLRLYMTLPENACSESAATPRAWRTPLWFIKGTDEATSVTVAKIGHMVLASSMQKFREESSKYSLAPAKGTLRSCKKCNETNDRIIGTNRGYRALCERK